MINQTIREYLLPQQFNAAVRAGAAIMKIYKQSDDYHVTMKSDHTPITIMTYCDDAPTAGFIK